MSRNLPAPSPSATSIAGSCANGIGPKELRMPVSWCSVRGSRTPAPINSPRQKTNRADYSRGIDLNRGTSNTLGGTFYGAYFSGQRRGVTAGVTHPRPRMIKLPYQLVTPRIRV